MICEICSQNEHKYKCPKCRIVYCSLNCYKTHKETCSTNVVVAVENVKLSNNNTEMSTDAGCTASAAENLTSQVESKDENKQDMEIEFKSEDLVDENKFKLLDDSKELKDLLSNRHLRDLLKTLNESSEKTIDFKMDKAMQEPLFTEFADVCLKIMQNPNELVIPITDDTINLNLTND